MSIDQWWPKLRPATREWLIENNGAALPREILAEIEDVAGIVGSDGRSLRQGSGTSDYHLPDADVDWIEAIANGEAPDPPHR